MASVMFCLDELQVRLAVFLIRHFSNFKIDTLCIGSHHLPVFGMNGVRYQHFIAVVDAVRHEHRLRQRRRAIINRRIGDLHACQHADETLKLEDGLQGAPG